jgi:hypothetical protein
MARPVVDLFIDREKPRGPAAVHSPMPQEVLAAIGRPLRIERVTVADGLIRYAARRGPGAEPGVLTFNAVRFSAEQIANAAAGGDRINLAAEARLMDAGTLSVQMTLPVAASSPSFHYAGTLTPMELMHLDDYMDGAARFEIKSGSTSGASFDIDVVDGHARGTVRGAYRNLQVAMLDPKTGSDRSVTNRVASVLVNHLKVRAENTPDKPDGFKEGRVDYSRRPEESFFAFVWFALRSGVVDLITS